MYNVYCYENKITGDVYIGITEYTLADRASTNFSGYRNCKRFYNAIQKYGVDKFNGWIFEVVYTKEEADQSEIFWIAEMRHMIGKEHVYNIENGGNTIGTHSEETKKKISKSLKGKSKSQSHKENMRHYHIKETKQKMSVNKTGENNPFFGKKHSKKTKEILILKRKDKKPMLGKHHSEETKNKISQAFSGQNHPLWGKKGIDNPKYGKYKNLTNEQIEDIIIDTRSQRELAKIYSVNRSTIQKIKNRSKKSE